MMTRSIVGRFLILAVLLVSLGVIVQAAIKITEQSGRKTARADAAPATLAALATSPANASPSPAPVGAPFAQDAAVAPMRVVYPGPLGDAPVQIRKIADAAPASPLPIQSEAPKPVTPAPQPAAVAPAPVVAATAPPQPAPVVVASTDGDAQPAADPASPAKGGVNLNHATVEALNHIGGGHIGQTIVQHRPYRSVEDLVRKRVVRRSVYEQIKNQVAAE